MESSSAPQTNNDSGARGRVRLSLRVLETLFIGAAGGLVFTAAHFPAGWLAGPMIFCAAAALLGRSLDVPQPLARGFS